MSRKVSPRVAARSARRVPCPSCGRPNYPNAANCWACNAPIASPTAGPEQQTPVQPPSQAQLPPPAPPQESSAIGLAALILGIASVFLGPLIALAGLILGIAALKRGGQGRAMGLAGLIMSIVMLALGLMMAVLFLALSAVFEHESESVFTPEKPYKVECTANRYWTTPTLGQGYEVREADSGRTFLVANVTVTSHEKKEIEIDSHEFELVTTNLNVYSAAYALPRDSRVSPLEVKLLEGGSATGDLVFEVPLGTQPKEVRCTASPGTF